ncbi:type II toxin-antitoxin system antitoxin DNA ADP-ribosyl glycohydrolase DarG [Parasphingopyxis marina]|uniref:Macro domain-containing protein n=1 Tax=Parasphingopyxis marina TaxID=2761622 RepID=A0A842I1N8_9SPHN|nr:macro domain-containing protein [Parasphingopyxis marina]MBC2779172.1 macro domain-containing protein [Parasphingopyxis marina]
MITYTQGNLLEADAEALVNTVNTVGVMGKGIALMFKENFPANFNAYAAACKAHEVEVGHMFVTERRELMGPKWIINFPTKKHWRHPSKLTWIDEGLLDLKRVIVEHEIRSIALPPLGSGNGGLEWPIVRDRIEHALHDLEDVRVIVYEPTATYQNVAKRTGVEKLTPARALVAELVRRYAVLGFECSFLEIQKLTYFAERSIEHCQLDNPLDLRFEANRFGPFAARLTHLLNALDGSYLRSDKRIGDAGPMDVVDFVDAKRDRVAAYLGSEAKDYLPALESTSELIDGFETPLGMELLSTVDWLIAHGAEASIEGIKKGLRDWRGGRDAGQRKLQLFNDRMIYIALERLASWHETSAVRAGNA